MKKIKTKFKDLFVVNTRVFKDNRGWVKEEFKKNFIKKNLVFSLVSSSKKKVLRGLHMQTKKPQDKFLSVLKGRVLDIAVDLRKNSKTFGKSFTSILSEKNSTSIYVPPGFAHGLCGLSKENYGRDHHPRCFTMWMCGGGARPGQIYGETDDFSYNIVKDPVHIRDFHATVLHLLGFDHERFTYRHLGLDQKLTGVEHAKIVQDLLA